MSKPVVGVLFGSRSTEHDVSIVTALAAVIKPLELSRRYQVLPIYIAKDGRWYADRALADIKLFTSGKIDDWLRKNQSVSINFDKGLRLQSGKRGRGGSLKVDVVFPALHGTHGEDGAAMGLLEMAGVPYVGCSVAASAVAMDKVLTKLVAQASGIAVTKFEHCTKAAFEADPDGFVTAINRHLRYPLFVKPAHLGSSIGITRVTQPDQLRNAIEVALHFDNKALVEEAVNNLIEVTLPVLGNDATNVRPGLLERPLTQAEDFFDFDTKYLRGGKKGGQDAGTKGVHGYSQIPAELPTELYQKAEATGLAVYRALGCSGIARVDLLIDSKAGVVYCNEVNPLPGSLYAHNWAEAGVSNVALVSHLVDLALERHKQQSGLETAFATNFLKQF